MGNREPVQDFPSHFSQVLFTLPHGFERYESIRALKLETSLGYFVTRFCGTLCFMGNANKAGDISHDFT